MENTSLWFFLIQVEEEAIPSPPSKPRSEQHCEWNLMRLLYPLPAGNRPRSRLMQLVKFLLTHLLSSPVPSTWCFWFCILLQPQGQSGIICWTGQASDWTRRSPGVFTPREVTQCLVWKSVSESDFSLFVGSSDATWHIFFSVCVQMAEQVLSPTGLWAPTGQQQNLHHLHCLVATQANPSPCHGGHGGHGAVRGRFRCYLLVSGSTVKR